MFGVTVNVTPLLASPPDVVITTGPVVAPLGTVAVILEFPQVALAEVPLNVTVPAVDPNVVPAMVTVAPTAPLMGVRLVMAGVTVNEIPLL
jgi:hypothetical protein